MKGEHQVKIEKGTLLGSAMLLITMGTERCVSGNLESGILMVTVGLFIMFAREHFKFHRWSSAVGSNSFWKGKNKGGGM